MLQGSNHLIPQKGKFSKHSLLQCTPFRLYHAWFLPGKVEVKLCFQVCRVINNVLSEFWNKESKEKLHPKLRTQCLTYVVIPTSHK